LQTCRAESTFLGCALQTLFGFFRRVHDHFAGFAGRARQGLASAAQRAERRSHHAQSADDRR
jgi:hypothetical protein